MANKKISELDVAATIDGTETLPLVQAGVTSKVDIATMLTDLGLKHVQEYFRYTYRNDVIVAADPTQGIIHFDNLNTNLATTAWVDNLTIDGAGIGTFMSSVPEGSLMYVLSTTQAKFGIMKVTSVTSAGGYRTFVFTQINGIALDDGEEVALWWNSVGNTVYKTDTQALYYNDTPISFNVTAYDTLASALSTQTISAATDRLEFLVTDPGGNAANPLLLPIPWNVMVDNSMGILRQMNGLSDFAMLKATGRYCQPAANASGTPSVDTTVAADRTRVTATAHGLAALVTGTDTYLVNQTAQNGWTANEKVKILTIVDANTLVLDKAFSTLTGSFLPDFYLVTETMPIGTILCPPLRTWSQLQFHFTAQMATSANNKTISLNWGGTDYYAPSVFTASKGIGRIVMIKNTGATDKQFGFALTTVNAGTEGSQTGGNVPSSTVNTLVATTANVNVAIANAADWVELINLVGSARW